MSRFEFAAVPVGPDVFAGAVVHPAEDALTLLHWYRDFVAEAPDELTTVVILRTVLPAPWLPAEHHWRRAVFMAACWAGDPAVGERYVEPLRRHGAPFADAFAVRPFNAHQQFFDATAPPGWGYYWKSSYTPAWSDSCIHTLATYAWRKTTPQSYTIIFQMGGAVRRIPEAATAFRGRDASFTVNINAVWTDLAAGLRDIDRS